ncbi:MAG: polynucleotide adenylyltransferase PcnB [Simkaniaceae bacterium]
MKPKKYHKKEHGIEKEQIDSHALFILERLKANGHEAFLVGGSVRDLLLGHQPKDFDISTSAKPEEVKAIFRNSILIGRRFRLAHIRFGRKVIEVATFRAGDPESEDLIVRDNVFGTPEEDVKRRDFTINGLFYEAESESIIDYVEGYPDTKKRFLRAIGQPYMRFKQDPVRMIRLLKFQARFGLDVCEEAKQALLDCRHEITKSSSARILEEIFRMLESKSSASFIRLMADHGLLDPLLPELGRFLEKSEGGEIYSYLEEVDTRSHLSRPLLLSALLFPIMEKHILTHFIDRKKNPHLGLLHDEALTLIQEVFNTFFSFPKRLKTQVANILANQYRITPIDPKRYRTIRIPNFPDFPDTVIFFGIRTALNPALQPIYEKWQEALTSRKKDAFSPPNKRRRRGPEKSPPRRRR